MSEIFWDTVHRTIAARSMTQKDLAETSGVSRTVINNGICHHHRPRLDHAYAVAKVLGVTVEYLLTGVHPDGLKNDAKELLGLFNELSEGGKELILGHTRLVYEQEKKESPEKRGKAAGASS